MHFLSSHTSIGSSSLINWDITLHLLEDPTEPLWNVLCSAQLLCQPHMDLHIDCLSLLASTVNYHQLQLTTQLVPLNSSLTQVYIHVGRLNEKWVQTTDSAPGVRDQRKRALISSTSTLPICSALKIFLILSKIFLIIENVNVSSIL